MCKNAQQLADEHYQKLKARLIQFHMTAPPERPLFWGTEFPLKIDSLAFVESTCGCCGIVYEDAEFEGQVCHQGAWCACGGTVKTGEHYCQGTFGQYTEPNFVFDVYDAHGSPVVSWYAAAEDLNW